MKVIDEKNSHWVAKGPAGHDVEWDAEVFNDAENEMIAAQSQDRFGQGDLAVRRLLRLDMVPFAEDDDFAKPFRGPQMNPHALMVLDALARRRPDLQIRVEAT